MSGLLDSLFRVGNGFQRVKREVLHWHAQGLTVKEISDKLGIARQIVEAVMQAYKENGK